MDNLLNDVINLLLYIEIKKKVIIVKVFNNYMFFYI